MGTKVLPSRFLLGGCSLKTEYPFIKHIPIAIAMSISHISGCAMICRKEDTGFHLFISHLILFRRGAGNIQL